MDEQEQGKWIIDTSGWKMKDQRAYGKAVREASETLDVGTLYPFYKRFVKSWPFGSDPRKDESYDDLEPEQWSELRKKVQDALSERFR